MTVDPTNELNMAPTNELKVRPTFSNVWSQNYCNNTFVQQKEERASQRNVT